MNLPTGYGKSLIFQCLPIAAVDIFERPRGSSVIVVISPLQALMEDQVRHLNDFGIPAIAITDEDDEQFAQQVLNCNFVVVYGSPECLLSTESRRSIFDCESFKKMLIGVAFDEAHCITQWYVAIICNLLIKLKINVAFCSKKSFSLLLALFSCPGYFFLSNHFYLITFECDE